METRTIMVQMADRQWTMETLHAACTLARGNGADIALVKMVPVQHLSWLGTEFGDQGLTAEEHDHVRSCQETAEDYGVTLSAHVFQYATLLDAIADAAAYVNAQIVFATIPESHIPYWHGIQVWALHRRLTHDERQLHTLDTPSDGVTKESLPIPVMPGVGQATPRFNWPLRAIKSLIPTGRHVRG